MRGRAIIAGPGGGAAPHSFFPALAAHANCRRGKTRDRRPHGHSAHVLDHQARRHPAQPDRRDQRQARGGGPPDHRPEAPPPHPRPGRGLLRRAQGAPVLRRADRVHQLRPDRRPGARGRGRDREEPRGDGRDQPGRGAPTAPSARSSRSRSARTRCTAPTAPTPPRSRSPTSSPGSSSSADRARRGGRARPRAPSGPGAPPPRPSAPRSAARSAAFSAGVEVGPGAVLRSRAPAPSSREVRPHPGREQPRGRPRRRRARSAPPPSGCRPGRRSRPSAARGSRSAETGRRHGKQRHLAPVAGGEAAQHRRVEPVLDRQQPRRQASRACRPAATGITACPRIGPASSSGVTSCTVQPCTAMPAASAAGMGVEPGEERQDRGMDVQHPPRPARDEARASAPA